MKARYELFPHQQEAIKKMSGRKRFALIMQPRSGKTLASLHILIKRKKQKNMLLVVPSGTMTTWEKEIKKFFGIEAYRVTTIGEAEKLKKIEGIVLITRKLLCYLKASARNLIVDEIHLIKGGDQFNALKRHADKAENVIALSGTPADNRPKDLYGLFRILHHECAYDPTGVKYSGDEAKKYQFLNRFCRSRTITVNGRQIQQYEGLREKDTLKSYLDDVSHKYFTKTKFVRRNYFLIFFPTNPYLIIIYQVRQFA